MKLNNLFAAAAGGALIAGLSFAAAVKILRANAPDRAAGDEGPCPGFEGPEKRFELNVRPPAYPGRTNTRRRGLRRLPRRFWDRCIALLNGKVLGKIENELWDAYLITESSLFVSATKVIILTCGTTTLLQCVPLLLAAVQELGHHVEWVQFSRKNYTYPEWQQHMHRGFEREMAFLREAGIEGDTHILGPISQDHYYFFAADLIVRQDGLPAPQEKDQLLILNMYDIDPRVSRLFWRPHTQSSGWDEVAAAAAATKAAGIDEIFVQHTTKGQEKQKKKPLIQQKLFDPCGYSMNGICDDTYHTIHVTPESHCSYASFETNVSLPSFAPVVQRVVGMFQPQRFTAMFFADKQSPLALAQRKMTSENKEALHQVPGYRMKCLCFHEFEPGYFIVLGNFLKIPGRGRTMTF